MSKLIWYWHVHHETLLEPIGRDAFNYTAANRRVAIRGKPKDEVKLRLRLFRRIRGKLPREFLRRIEIAAWSMTIFEGEVRTAARGFQKQILALHKRECKNCPWESRRPNSLYGTIFPGKKR